ncbi:hypothetical protein [Pelagimonas phthalicica]|nr:hypothetical protein [Pelagimonas phthalicica]
MFGWGPEPWTSPDAAKIPTLPLGAQLVPGIEGRDMKKLSFAMVAILVSSQVAIADTALSGTEIRKFLSGATIVFEDGEQKWQSNGKTVAIFFSSQGREVVNGTWKVEGNKLCESFPNTGRQCMNVVVLTGGDVRFIPGNGNHYTGSKIK